MPQDRLTSLDLARPRSTAEILATALRLYGRWPLLFLALALIVVAPYDLLVLAVSGATPLGQNNASASTVLILALFDFALVGPLVSAFQVQAVLMIGEGGRPVFREVFVRGMRALPVVAAAEIIAGIAIGLGLIAFIVPGIILALRFAVVAQVAAVEKTDWPGALRRSGQLTSRNYLRIFGLLLIVAVVNLLLSDGVGQLAGTSAAAPQVALGIAVGVVTRSFQALVLAVLYFDLRFRDSARTADTY